MPLHNLQQWGDFVGIERRVRNSECLNAGGALLQVDGEQVIFVQSMKAGSDFEVIWVTDEERLHLDALEWALECPGLFLCFMPK